MTASDLCGLVAHASSVQASERGAFVERIRRSQPGGTVLIVTCHRVELHGAAWPDAQAMFDPPDGSRVLQGTAVADHVVALAVGLRSAIVAEDQLLHQVRSGVEAARTNGPLPSHVDRLFDLALRAGRRARSWLPARRPTLADVALDRLPESIEGRGVLVVGAGAMGRLSAGAAASRGAHVAIASRTQERAVALAGQLHLRAVPFDLGNAIGEYAVVIVALRGPWPVDRNTLEGLIEGRLRVIDLSAPPSLPERLRIELAGRLVTIDDLARRSEPDHEERVVARLRALSQSTVGEYLDWCEREPQRATARDMVELADEARRTELADLWQRLPGLRSDERAQIERMTRHLADRLLEAPLQRLGRDPDGRNERAARELFGL